MLHPLPSAPGRPLICGRILVLDDEPVILDLMVEILADAEYQVDGAGTFDSALDLLAQHEYTLVVCDIVMPGYSGLDVLDAIHVERPSMPVVLVTGAGTYENLSQALSRGAAGLVTKPFAHAELLDTVADAIARTERKELELRERLLTPTLASALANAIEARDPYLHGHCERLAALAVRLAVRMGLPASQVEGVRLGAILHDIGKIGIADRILRKPGPLDADERAEILLHPVIGDQMLAPLDALGTSRLIVRHHHERWDGSGYPDRLAGAEIPLGGRIVAVADAIEVMSSRSVYRRTSTPAEILSVLQEERGRQWDPDVVDVALTMIAEGELALAEGGFSLEEPEPALALAGAAA